MEAPLPGFRAHMVSNFDGFVPRAWDVHLWKVRFAFERIWHIRDKRGGAGALRPGALARRCPNSAHIRQSRPDSGLRPLILGLLSEGKPRLQLPQLWTNYYEELTLNLSTTSFRTYSKSILGAANWSFRMMSGSCSCSSSDLFHSRSVEGSGPGW